VPLNAAALTNASHTTDWLGMVLQNLWNQSRSQRRLWRERFGEEVSFETRQYLPLRGGLH